MKKVYLSVVAAAFVLTGMILFTGCSGNLNAGKSLMVSAGGLKAESLLPDDVWMVMKFGSSDMNQIEKLDKLTDLFPADFVDYIIEEAATGFNEDNVEYGIDFKEDIMPAVGENWQLMVAFSGVVSDETEPVLMAVFMPRDAGKIEEIMGKMPENGKGSEIKWEKYTIYSNESEDAFFVRFEDVMLLSNDIEALKSAVSGKNKGTLLYNASYNAGADKVGENIGFMFMDPSFIVKQMQDGVSSDEELEEVKNLVEITSTVKGEFFGLSVEDDGLRIKGFVLMDMAKWKDLGLPEIDDNTDSYLYKRLPGEGIVIYSEGYNLQKNLEMVMDMYKDIDEMSYAFSMIRASLAMQKLDLEDDILVFMDRGYVFSMYEHGGLMPEIGLYFDAESNPEAAKKIMSRINEGIDGLLAEGEMDEEVLAAITNEKAVCGEGECYVFEMDFAKLPEEGREELGVEFADMKISMQYGVDSGNLAFFALYPDFLDGKYETLESNALFMDALKDVTGFNSQVSFMDVESLAGFVDGWVQYGLKAEGNEDGEGMEDYKTVMEYLRPVKYMVSGSKAFENGEVEMEAFIKLSK